MNSIPINTSQNVNLYFPMVSVGDRILAFIIDSIIKAAYLIFLFLIFFEVLEMSVVIGSWDGWSITAFFSIVTLPVTLYTLLCESLMEGQTPGKKIMQCKVIKIDGFQASFIDYLTRWVFRIIDVLISSGVVGLMSILMTEKGQRLGGLASGTAVISLKQKSFLSETVIKDLEEDYQPRFPQVVALTDEDMRIIVKNYHQAVRERRYDIINKLAEKIRDITTIANQNPEMNDQAFITKVIEDFNHYTGKD